MYGRSFMGVLRNTYLIGADGRIAQHLGEGEGRGPCRRGAGRRQDPAIRPCNSAPMHPSFTLERIFTVGSGKINHDGLKSTQTNTGRKGIRTGCRGASIRPTGRGFIGADSGRPVPPNAYRQRRCARGDYTLVHAGRQFRLGPVAFWIVVGNLVIMAGWSVATGTYFAFHDDVLKRLIARQAEQQFAYEDRIAELRAQVDRIASRQLLDQEQFEQKLEQIMRRQATLESRGRDARRRARSRRRPARSADALPRRSSPRTAAQSPRRSATP